MNIRLKIRKGTRAGEEFNIPAPRCLIGRGRDCHLQPKSEAISRHHCVVLIHDGRVFIQDLESRNGTFVNGQLVKQVCELHAGDVLTIGPLSFEVRLEGVAAEQRQRPAAQTPVAAQHTARDVSQADGAKEGNFVDWLEEADERARIRRMQEPETRQLQLGDTEQIQLQRATGQASGHRLEDKPAAEPETTSRAMTLAEKAALDQALTPSGKLPVRPVETTEDSSEAAAHALRRFFERRG
jgi:hypothetical protein